LGAKDICRLLAQLALDLLGIDSQAFSYIVDCLLNSGLFFTDLGRGLLNRVRSLASSYS
jgi:hypothetical protein